MWKLRTCVERSQASQGTFATRAARGYNILQAYCCKKPAKEAPYVDNCGNGTAGGSVSCRDTQELTCA